jgi:lipid-binding SYLF domain-containing protein
LLALAGLVVAMVAVGPARAGNKEWGTLEAAGEVVDALAAVPLKSIPPALFHDAQGVAVFPGVVKAGLVIGGRYGEGVVLAREPSGAWGHPVFLRITGGSIGWQIGVQSTDLVLIFKTRAGVERLLKGKDKITLGADVAVAAGPAGRQAEAATDAQLKAEIYSYSRTRGLFAGLSLEGAALLADDRSTQAYYQSLRRARTIPLTPPDDALRLKLAMLSATWVTPAPGPFVPPPPPPPQNTPVPFPAPLPPMPPPSQRW